jgi:hypothetical protein
MNREELLKLYLSDPLTKEMGYIKEEEIENISWSEKSSQPIIEVLKSLITSQIHHENQSIAVRKANKVIGGEL